MMDVNTSKDEEGHKAQESDSKQELLSLSYAAAEGIQGPKAMHFQGLIKSQEVLILVGSGSSSTFVSEALVQELKLPTMPISATTVTFADGGEMSCDKMVPDLQWWSQGQTFESPAKVLAIKCNDLILGTDWLQQHSSMWVHWKHKKMRFTHKGSRITLRGIKDCTSKCLKLKPTKLKGLLRKGGIAQMIQVNQLEAKTPLTPIPTEVQQLLKQYESLFRKLAVLLPQRKFDHSNNLIPGVPPVNIKPYQYNPTQKDEIERQVREMLLNGVIQPSTSPFASPVLLVKKKDGSWRFCIDFRQLNTITIKNKYPLPIVDKLLDELHGARYFTKLYMSAGYHQIRLLTEDECITAFKTHHGHREFRVRPFGLTNAPATFQAVMNTIFAPLLR
jgi:hypothetical protein